MQGEILNARYRIIEKLGRGGFGETYLATDEWLDRENRCVVKQLRPNIINKATLPLFEQEAEVLFKLGTHDQIPQLLAHFEQEETFYLVQEYIEGHDLSNEIEEGKCWDENKVTQLLKDILTILEFVHQNNVIHRDIKPGNIMRRSDGKIVLIDFGGVKQVTTQTSAAKVSTHAVGTPGYMPQEQIYNNTQLCSDIYAVGMLAIEALVGENPIDIPTDSKTNQPIWRDKADVSERLADVIDKMVRFNFEERYQSVDKALNAVENLSFTVSSFYREGEKLYQLQKFKEAVAVLDKAIEIKPNFYQAWTLKGLVLKELEMYDEAFNCCDEAIRINQHYAKAWIVKASILSNLDNHQEALAAYQEAIDIQPNNYQYWTGKALILSRLGKYQEALDVYQQAIDIKPNGNANGTNLIIVPYARLDWFNKEQTFSEVFEEFFAYYSEPKNDDYTGLMARAQALIKSKEYNQALDCCDIALKIKPNDLNALNNRSVALSGLNRIEEAIATCNKLVEYYPDYSLAWYNRAYLFKQSNDLTSWNYQNSYKQSNIRNEQIFSCNRVLQIPVNEARGWYIRGDTLFKLKKYKQAIISYQQALKTKPASSEILFNILRSIKNARIMLFLSELGYEGKPVYIYYLYLVSSFILLFYARYIDRYDIVAAYVAICITLFYGDIFLKRYIYSSKTSTHKKRR